MTEAEHTPPPIYPVEIIPMERRKAQRRRSTAEAAIFLAGDDRRSSRGRRAEDRCVPDLPCTEGACDVRFPSSEVGCGRLHARAAEAIGLICDALEKLTEPVASEEVMRARAIAESWKTAQLNEGRCESE